MTKREAFGGRIWAILLSAAGIAGLAYETYTDQGDHPSRDWAFLMLALLPLILRHDDKNGTLSRFARRMLERIMGVAPSTDEDD